MKPLVDGNYLLERFPGKGGWTYAEIPEVLQNPTNPFGWVKVRGSIDRVEFEKYHLMPMGEKRLFLPVKAAIRKQIKKQAGDWVHIVLYTDNEPLVVPEEMLMCLQDEPRALEFFNALSESEQKYYIRWIYEAKKIETRVNRLAKAVNRLANGEKFHGNE